MDKELKKIKKLFGEEFAKWCRETFTTILNYDGTLLEILLKKFHPTRSLWEAIKDSEELLRQVEDEIYREFDLIVKKDSSEDSQELDSPELLCDKVGYILIKCETVEDVKLFKAYYDRGEELCTFWDIEDRLESHFIFFAVRRDVDEIERSEEPSRDDDYGTSVMSLQFDKRTGRLSIKNRYNHTVIDPDATLDNNLERIAPGLTESFEQYYGIKQKNVAENTINIPGTVTDENGKIYFFNYCIEGVYYCEDNVVIENGRAYQYPKDRYELIDYFLYDKDTETIEVLPGFVDGFTKTFDNVDKVDIVKGEGGCRIFKGTNKDGTTFEITVDSKNRMVGYVNNDLKRCESRFCTQCAYIQHIELANVEEIYHSSFASANVQTLIAPKVERIFGNCFYSCYALKELNLPSIRLIGDDCFVNAIGLKTINCPNLDTLGYHSLRNVDSLTEIYAPKLTSIGLQCFERVESLQKVDLPSLVEMVGSNFRVCYNISEINCPNLKEMGNLCFNENCPLTEINFPKLKEMGRGCFQRISHIEKIEMPVLESMRESCFQNPYELKKLNLPSLKKMYMYCFQAPSNLEELNMPNLEEMGELCFSYCDNLETINLPSLVVMKDNCFIQVPSLKKLCLPKLLKMGQECFREADSLEVLSLPKLTYFSRWNFAFSENLKRINVPSMMVIPDQFQKLKNLEALRIAEVAQLYSFGAEEFLKKNADKIIFVKNSNSGENTDEDDGDEAD